MGSGHRSQSKWVLLCLLPLLPPQLQTRNDSTDLGNETQSEVKGKCLSVSLFLRKGSVSGLTLWAGPEGWGKHGHATRAGLVEGWGGLCRTPEGARGCVTSVLSHAGVYAGPKAEMGCVCVCVCVSGSARLLYPVPCVLTPLPDHRQEEYKTSWVSENSVDTAKRMEGLRGSQRKEGSQRSDPDPLTTKDQRGRQMSQWMHG